ncbi:MAG TPA: lysylphosphatidylglycerol synthase transmembrane domain-containing protein [Pseudolabrys sp.]|nr:lysylphosphatidylglycerol synthase transmembrane domain-containing protein [Pseudolabrys sp.]
MRLLSSKVLIISVIQIALTVILLIALARLLDPAKLRQLLQAANPVWLTVGFAILVAQQIISAERWRLVVMALSAPQYRMWFYLFWQGLSMLCSMVLPSVIGADLVRTYALSGRTPIGTVVRIVLIDRALGLLALSTLVIVSVLILPRFFLAQPLLLLSVAIAICGPLTYLALTRLVPSLKGSHRLVLAGRQLGLDLKRTVEGAGSLRVILISLSLHLLSIAAFCALGNAIVMPGVDLVHYLAIVSSALLVTIIPISIGGWGIRESALIIGFGMQSVEPERAFTLSAIFGLLVMLSCVVVAVFGIPTFFQKPVEDLADAR